MTNSRAWNLMIRPCHAAGSRGQGLPWQQTFGWILILFSSISVAAFGHEPGENPKAKPAAERLRDSVDAIEKPLYDKCLKEGEVCGGTDEDKAKANEAVRLLLLDRFHASTSPDELVVISDFAPYHIRCKDQECYTEARTLSFNAAKKAARLGPDNPAANMAYAMGLWQQAQKNIRDEESQNVERWRIEMHNPTEVPPSRFLDEAHSKYNSLFVQAERYAKRAMQLTAKPSWLYYANLASIEEELPGKDLAAYTNYQHALSAARREEDAIEAKITLNSLWPLAFALDKLKDGKAYHQELADMGELKDSDWFVYALRLVDQKDYAGAAEAYIHAAELAPTAAQKANHYASSASCFYFADRNDEALAAARNVLQLGESADTASKAEAVRLLSDILAARGVYDDALRYGEQAVAAKPDDHRNQFSLGNALYQLHRYQEAVTTLKEALRLSDGKYGYEHFLLGNIYFDMQSWDDAASAFKHAAEIDKSDSGATYNVALCYENKGYRSDAADWYEETLRRNPQHTKREQILKSIAHLRAK